jgi:hypothetical protein
MRTHHDDLERLHSEWLKYEDGKSTKEIYAKLVEINSACSNAEDTAKLIENGGRSYESI